MDVEAELKMRGHIYDLVMTGNYYVTQEEWDELEGEYVDLFYDRYEHVIQQLHIAALPLRFDSKKNSFSLLPSFLMKTFSEELAEYCRIFHESFTEVFGPRQELGKNVNNEGRASAEIEEDDDDEEDEDYEEDEDDLEDDPEEQEEFLPVLFYRVPNQIYAESMVDTLMGLTEKPDIMDEYGWIEDRKSLFIDELAILCEEYKLPLLPVGFDKKGKPYFKATKTEVTNFKTLCVERRSMEELRKTMLKEAKREARVLEKNFDKQEVVDRFLEIFKDRKKEWEKENKKYNFPSAITEYPDDAWSDDNDDRIFLLMVENAEMTDGPKGSHDTTDRKIMIRPFLYEFHPS